jgi:hypothetical protein
MNAVNETNRLREAHPSCRSRLLRRLYTPWPCSPRGASHEVHWFCLISASVLPHILLMLRRDLAWLPRGLPWDGVTRPAVITS